MESFGLDNVSDGEGEDLAELEREQARLTQAVFTADATDLSAFGGSAPGANALPDMNPAVAPLPGESLLGGILDDPDMPPLPGHHPPPAPVATPLLLDAPALPETTPVLPVVEPSIPEPAVPTMAVLPPPQPVVNIVPQPQQPAAPQPMIPAALPLAPAPAPAPAPPPIKTEPGAQPPPKVAPRLQVTDILRVLARLLAKSQWDEVQTLVQKLRKSEKPFAEMNKKSFIAELREVVGNDLWRDTILEIQRTNHVGAEQVGSRPRTPGADGAAPAANVVSLETTRSLPLQPNAQLAATPAQPQANHVMQPPANTTAPAPSDGKPRAPSVREVINAVKWLVPQTQHATLDMLSSQYVKNQITQHQLEARLKAMIGHDGLLRAFRLATKKLPMKGPATATPEASGAPAMRAASPGGVTSPRPNGQQQFLPIGGQQPQPQQQQQQPTNTTAPAQMPQPGMPQQQFKLEAKLQPVPPAMMGKSPPVDEKSQPQGLAGLASPNLLVASQAKEIVGHAYHCRNNNCPVPKCFDTKCKLLQLARHAEQCSNTPQTTDTCKLCRMWTYVKNMPDTKMPSPGSEPVRKQDPGDAIPRPVTGGTNIRRADPETMKQALRLKLQEHFRSCPGCSRCKKWQQQIKHLRQQQEKDRQSNQHGAPGESTGKPAGKPAGKRAPKRPRPSKDDKKPRLAGLGYEEGDWVKVKSKADGSVRLARVMQIDSKILVQYVASLGLHMGAPPSPLHIATVILGFEHVPQAQYDVELVPEQPKSSEYPDIEHPHLKRGFYVDYRSHGDEDPDGWWPGEIVEADNLYTVRLERHKESEKSRRPRKLSAEEQINAAAEAGRQAASLAGAPAEAAPENLKTKVRREELRLVCGHPKCRSRQVRFELAQKWCSVCSDPVRYPGSTFFVETQSSLDAYVNKTGSDKAPIEVVLHKECYNKVRSGKVDTSKWPRPIDVQHIAGNFKEVTMPKEGLEHTATDVGYDIGELLPWIQCSECGRLYHQVCAMYNDRLMILSWKCEVCRTGEFEQSQNPYRYLEDRFTVQKGLHSTPLSKYIERRIEDELKNVRVDMVATPSISIRVVSTLECFASTPQNVQSRDWSIKDPYPTELPYTSRCIMAFQNQNGAEVAIFCMYVQEYGSECPQPNTNRVYISYLDSVRYFECAMLDGSEPPRGKHRTTVYHSFLLAYMEYIRDHGFTHVHIWVEPPKQFDEYIFFARPIEDRYTDANNTMKREKLRLWYLQMLEKAQAKGIVMREEGIQSLHDAFMDIKSAREIPLFKGDQWEVTISELIGKDLGKQPLGLVRQDSTSLMTSIKRAMKDQKDHFLVARLTKATSTRKTRKEPIISSLFTNSREAFQFECVKQHWQFNTLRFAKYSTMMLVHFFISSPKPDLCKPDCKRGRVDDGYGMVGCDKCEKWFHYECASVTNQQLQDKSFNYVCTECQMKEQESQARAHKKQRDLKMLESGQQEPNWGNFTNGMGI